VESGSDGDYPSAESILSAAEGLRTGSEQLTYLLFLSTCRQDDGGSMDFRALGNG